MSTRRPCKNPREAMEIIATLIGADLDKTLSYLDAFPECRLVLRLGRHEATVYACPEVVEFDGEDHLVIGCSVTWPSSHYTASEAAEAAILHALAAQKAALIESVSHGRRWKMSDVKKSADDACAGLEESKHNLTDATDKHLGGGRRGR